MKKIAALPFTELPSVPHLIRDFLSGNLAGFQAQTFSAENFSQQIKRREETFTDTQREILSNVLSAQHAGQKLSSRQQENLGNISRPGTFTVTTGHQLNLFTGPVFFIVKILQTIKLAEYLTAQFPANRFVPVFWMATEDHDFEEIRFFRTEKNRYEIAEPSGGAVGRIPVSDKAFIEAFEKEFGGSAFGGDLVEMLREAYRPGKSLATATRQLVNRLFSDYGLLILDGDDVKLKAQMRGVFKNDLLHSQLLHSTRETVKKLTDTYGKVQVNPRESNLFYLTETRNRIDPAGEAFIINETGLTFTWQEILEELENHPERFSPNALLRPVFQETVLPNIAYVGGNAEIMYWLELRDYFSELQLPFPVLLPRNSALFLRQKTLDKIKKEGLELEDFFHDFEAVKKGLLLDGHDISTVLQETEKQLQAQFRELIEVSEMTDKSFGQMVQAEETRQLKSFSRLEKRLLRAEKIKQAERNARLDLLYQKVHPGGVWQERTLNFSVFYADLGNDWLRNCYDALDVRKSELLIFVI